ncbi:MAG: DUF1015 domain-containing protein [Solirubrobacteraceae bacterium]
MAAIRPLTALHYDLERAGPLRDLIAPPYDVIDADQREALAARSPYNVVHVDLPTGDDPYENAARTFGRWRDEGAVVLDTTPALWALTQEFTDPGGARRTRSGFLCAVRVEPYGAGRIRPHERTHPGPKEDRLRLTRATEANLSPIFALYDDRRHLAWSELADNTAGPPFAEATSDDGTMNRLWRIDDDESLDIVEARLDGTELLIADGHHRYETARVYADEVGGEGPHRWVLMCLVALQDPGLELYPTHRLARGVDPEGLADAIRRDFDIEEIDRAELVPDAPAADERIRVGYMDSHFKRAFRLTLKDPAIADRALPGKPEPYRRLDTAIVEALLLKGAIGMSDDDIAQLNGLGYARDFDEAVALIDDATYDVGFFMGAVPVEHVQAVAAAGENMPPKSTFFAPKVPTGLVFNPLSDR